ncbi:hypothetical protein GQ53DRAFT_800252 [Thozetella sp. PMI_491]|nr:hypothetical protein GQ53DRAFT_800252 [Thozetella sp. PMI_491]
MSAPQDSAVPSSGSSSNSNTNTPAPSTAATTTSASSAGGADESLSCRWKDCTEHFESAERLYDHICDKHVGRKSTNNLNLTCMWNSCRTTTVKRDHITSHIRVHVPLKPHKCDFCGKSFKRPQDLKKHVKTHADDSILTNRGGPDPNGAGLNSAFRAHAPKAPASYYDHNGHMRTNSAAYGQPPQNGGSYYSHHPAQPAYQPMYHYQQQPMTGGRGDFLAHQAASSFESRGKRPLDEPLNDFFGALKRRQIDTSNYSSVGRSLMPIHSTSLGIQAAGGGMATEYMAPAHPPALSVGGGASHGHGPLTQHYYLPPMPNLRTKEDLRDIDHILQQMQATVYENTGSPESTHYSGVDMRHQSPAYATRPSIDPYAVSAAQVASPLTSVSSTHSTGTPAVTPPSSTMSYTSGHSPSASSAGMSPSSRHSSTSVAYPNLPAVAHPQSNLSGLGTSFTSTERRLSGGVLQSANASARAREASEGATTPRASDSLSAVSSPSGESDNSEPPETYDNWIHNMRLLETLRKAIRERLENHDYDDAEADESRIDPMVLDSDNTRAPPQQSASEAPRAERPLYPALPNWS